MQRTFYHDSQENRTPVVRATPAEMSAELVDGPPARGRAVRPRRRGWLLLTLILTGSVGTLFVLGAGLVVLILLVAPSHGTEIQLRNGSQLYYTSAVTETEARQLANHLETQFLKDSSNRGTIQLHRSENTYQVRFVVKEWSETNDLTVLGFQVYGVRVSQEVFNGAPVEVHLCDPSFNTVRVLKPLGK
jgi:hypothetical protein